MDGFKSYIPDIIKRLDKAASRAFTKTGMAIQGDIRKSMKSGGKAAKVVHRYYSIKTQKRVVGKGARPVSAVGSPPNVQTGTLRRDVGYDVTPGLAGSVRVGVNVKYGAVHELSRKFPRPFIKPGIVGGVKKAQETFAEELKRL